MKTLTSSLLLALVLALTVLPVAAQDAQPTEPPQSIQSCLRLTSTGPLQGLDAAALGALLIDGTVTVEVLEPEACGPVAEASESTSDPTSEPQSEPEPGGYVDFVAHGAGAAIELAALAQKSENAKGLDGLDRAAKRLRKWSQRQIKWLHRHPPDACYADVHRQWHRGVVQVRDGSKAVRTSVRTLRPEPMRRAVRQLASGAANLVDVDLDEVTQACIEAARDR